MIGRVYKITNADESIVYIGSTTQTLNRRWQMHSKDYKRWVNGLHRPCSVYHHFKEFGIDNFDIRLISEHEIENRRQLHEFEQLVIDSSNCVNSQAAKLTEEQKLFKAQQYRDEHVEKHKAYSSERIECGCGGSHRRSDKGQHSRTKKHQSWLDSQS
jgi:hypothetical protein